MTAIELSPDEIEMYREIGGEYRPPLKVRSGTDCEEPMTRLNRLPKTARERHDSAMQSFRLVAFHVAYDLYRNVDDLTLRFGYALIYSSQPIRDRRMVDAWYEWTKGRSMNLVLKEDKPVPEILKPIIDAYRNAVAKRAWEIGDDEDSPTNPKRKGAA